MNKIFLFGVFLVLVLTPMASSSVYILESHNLNSSGATSSASSGVWHEFIWYNNGVLEANLTSGSGVREVNLT